MEDLKNLIINYKYFVEEVLTTESELYDNYYELKLTEEEQEEEHTDKIITEKILADILYDFIFNINAIKENLSMAMDFFYDDYSQEKTLEIYQEIKTIFKDFKIDDLEEILEDENKENK